MNGRAPLDIMPLAQESAPLRRKVAAAVRSLVVTGQLAGGQRLIEKELCTALGVSRTVLREALRELESEGLLSAGPRGLFVTVLDRREAEKVYAIRAILEGLIAREFCREAEDADIATLQAAMDALRAAYAGGALENLFAAKRDFYAAIAHGARNPVALDLLDRVNGRTNRLRTRSLASGARLPESLAELERLTAALVRRDATAAGELAEHHVDQAGRAALGTIDTTRETEIFQ